MTFDGGVGSQTVPVLKALKDNGAVATFHVVTAYFKDVSVITNLQAAYSDGHLIGLRVRNPSNNIFV